MFSLLHENNILNTLLQQHLFSEYTLTVNDPITVHFYNEHHFRSSSLSTKYTTSSKLGTHRVHLKSHCPDKWPHPKIHGQIQPTKQKSNCHLIVH